MADACKNIAQRCKNLSAERAYLFGLLHDIGRYAGISSERHLIEGYRYCFQALWKTVSVNERNITMADLTSMINIGKEMSRKLISIGIDSPEKLRAAGSRKAFLKLKEAYPGVCLVHLYTLEGAIQNIGFNDLCEDTKKELKEFSDFLKK